MTRLVLATSRTGHRLKGITDCDIIEASTTWRLADDYARPHETLKQRKKERGEE